MNRTKGTLALFAALLTTAGLARHGAAQCTGYNMTVVQNPPILPGITDIGIHNDDAVGTIPLPFTVTIYGQSFVNVSVCTNGQLTMGPVGTAAYSNACLPTPGFPNIALCPFWDDLRTDGAGQGIFTATYGAVGSRIFVIEWRAAYFSGYSGIADFGVVFREHQTYFDFEYLNVNDGAGGAQSEGVGATAGVQPSASGPVSQLECNSGGLINPVVRFTCAQYSAPACSLSFSPPGGQPGTSFNAFCTVTPGNGPVSTGLVVSLDASSLGGGTLTLHDDGIAPDAAANDNVFSGTVTSSGTMAPAGYVLTSNVSDAQGRSSSCSETYTVFAPCGTYGVYLSQSSMPPGAIDLGNHGDDMITTFTLPFPVNLYGQQYTQATVSSNGNMTMGPSGNNTYINDCLPSGVFPGVTVAPFWDDLRTDGLGQGIFMGGFGSAPNRALVIEWRAGYYSGYTGIANFAVYLYESAPVIDFVYGNVNDGAGGAQSEGHGATVGIQRSGSGPATQYSCNTGTLLNGDWLRFSCLPPTDPTCAPALSQTRATAGMSVAAFCTVTPGGNPASTGLAVSLNASAVGGGIVALHDDGVAPDVAANDNVFSGTVTSSPGTAAGTYTLTSTVSDQQNRTGSCNVQLEVVFNDECNNTVPVSLGNTYFNNINATGSLPPACGFLANDLWYSFSDPLGGIVTVSTCGGTLGDSAVAAYSDCATLLACNDDACGPAPAYQSRITFCASPSATYLLRIGGYAGTRWTGTFNIAIDRPPPPPYSNPSTYTPEGEPCGINVPDTVDGGCNSSPERYVQARLCTNYVGSCANGSGYRDTDWYRFTLSSPLSVDIVGMAQFRAFIFVVSGPCTNLSTEAFFYNDIGNPCTPTYAFASTVTLGAGTHDVVIVPQGFGGDVVCGTNSQYWLNASPSQGCAAFLCCRADFDGDGDIGTDADIQAFFACLAGNCCPTCPPDSDFNCDGDIGTDTDIQSFFRVLAGGPC